MGHGSKTVEDADSLSNRLVVTFLQRQSLFEWKTQLSEGRSRLGPLASSQKAVRLGKGEVGG
jgi:hypothetical protein